MEPQDIRNGLDDISAEKDPTLKSLKLASLCSALWAERGVELVVVGGSAIELLTEGAYASGDLDMCHVTTANLPIRDRQEMILNVRPGEACIATDKAASLELVAGTDTSPEE